MSRSSDIFGMTTSGFLSVVLVNVALVIALGFGLHQVQVESEREARAEAALAETRNLVGLCRDVYVAMGQYTATRSQKYRETCGQESRQISLTLNRLKDLVSEDSANVATMTRVQGLVARELQFSREGLELIDQPTLCSGFFRLRHTYKQIRQLEVDLQAEITSLNLKEVTVQSHRARDIASQVVRLTLTIAMLINGAMALLSAFAVIRPRPLFPLGPFR